MTKYHVMGAIVVVMLVVSALGGHFGFSVHGVPQGGVDENILVSGFTFFCSMLTFQVDDMPAIFSLLFIFINLMLGFLLLDTVLGG